VVDRGDAVTQDAPEEPWVAATRQSLQGKPLELEDAWQVVLDGLQIHRWYLHGQPAIDAFEEDWYDRWAAGWPAPQALERIRSSVPTGWRFHAFVDTERCERLGRLAAALGGAYWRPLALDEEECDRVDGILTVPAALPVGEPILSPRRPHVERALQLSLEARLGYYPAIGARVVIVGPSAADAETPPLTVGVPDTSSTVALAAEIVTRGVGEWVGAFLADAVTREAAPTYDVAWDGETVAATSALLVVAQAASRHRFLTELAEQQERHRLDDDEWRALTALISDSEAEIDALGPSAYELADSIDDVLLRELVLTSFPGERKFERYRRGTGAGQAV
jgi:hypothetical protein